MREYYLASGTLLYSTDLCQFPASTTKKAELVFMPGDRKPAIQEHDGLLRLDWPGGEVALVTKDLLEQLIRAENARRIVQMMETF